MRQRLQTNAKLAAHPDSNLLSAFMERSLAQPEQSEVLQHLSQCINCREIVSLSARQPNVTDVVSLATQRAGWVSWPALRWGAAVTCIFVVGAAITLRQKHAPGERSAIEASRSNHLVLDRPAYSQSQTLNPEPVHAHTNRNPSRNKEAGSAPVEMADARASSPFAEIIPGRAKDAVVAPQGGEAGPTTGGLATNSNGLNAPSDTFFTDNLAAETLAPRWTLSWDGVLQRSLDSGRTWQTIPVASHIVFRALAANGLDIWVGGKAGALFHSSDAGQHWTQMFPVANGQAFAGDIVGVEFSDTLHGKLTSSNHEIWITSDSGQTWDKQ